MSDFLGQLGTFFSSPTGKGLGTLAGLGSAGAGLYGNIAADQQRGAAAKQAQANAALTPAQLGAQVTQATQPLNANLVQAITRNVSANLAEEGLSQAPGIQASAIAQGLAPAEQQNQQTALSAVLARLGLPAEFAKTIPPNTNMNQLLALLTRQNNPSGSGGFTLPTQPNPGADTAGTYDFGNLTSPGSNTGDFGSLFPTNASTG